MEYADLIKQYAVLENISHSWDGEGEYVIFVPISHAHRIARILRKITKTGARSRMLRYKKKRFRILWK